MSVLEFIDTPIYPSALSSSHSDDQKLHTENKTKSAAQTLATPDELVDQIIAQVGKKIVIGVPLAIGKPIAFINALYQRAKADPSISLRIETGITLEKPIGKSTLEKNFLGPFVKREFANVPDIDYICGLRKGDMPSNICVNEFFFKAGSFLNSTQQLNYTSTNYTHAVRDLLDKGVNVVAQIVAKRVINGVTTYSLCSNSDLALDFIPEMDRLKAEGVPMAIVGEVNNNMPFMRNHAEVADCEFDFILDGNLNEKHEDYALFAAPNASISQEDHMIGLYSSALIKDGGTLQVGIGSLSSALTYSTMLRHQNNPIYQQILHDLQVAEKFPLSSVIGETGTFEEGLYGCSELMVDGFMHLFKAGILKREVFEDLTIQTLLNEKKITPKVTISTLLTLLEHNAISSVLNSDDVAYLKRIGVFKSSVQYHDGLLNIADSSYLGHLKNEEALQWITKHCLNSALCGGVVMHGAFFIGPKDFYDALNSLTDAEHDQFCMTSVNFVNELYDHFLGSQQLKQAQRKHARFINSAMMVTLNGSVISDALENGQVVSGVGGQYNFVAQAHQLPGARSILKLRSCCVRGGKLQSNILFNYGHTTIPRHLRDTVITEYGIADLRSKSDHVVYTELIKIADSRFQQELLAKAKAAGKVAKDYQIPAEFCNNTPEAIAQIYNKYTAQDFFGPFPFGCSFTEEELKLGKALKSLKNKTATRKGKVQCLWQALSAPKPTAAIEPLLKRIGMNEPNNLQDRITKRLLTAELSK